jgi:hypothetical protein
VLTAAQLNGRSVPSSSTPGATGEGSRTAVKPRDRNNSREIHLISACPASMIGMEWRISFKCWGQQSRKYWPPLCALGKSCSHACQPPSHCYWTKLRMTSTPMRHVPSRRFHGALSSQFPMPCCVMVVSRLGSILAPGLLVRLCTQGYTIHDTHRCIHENDEHCISRIFGGLTHDCTRKHSKLFLLGMQTAQ